MGLEMSEKGKALCTEVEHYVKDYVKVENFIEKVLQDEPIKHYFVWETMGRSLSQEQGGGAVATTKVTIVTDKNFLEFIFNVDRLRYDIVPIDDFARIEEVHYTKARLDGKVIPVMEARIDGRYQEFTQDYLVEDKKVKELEAFIKAIREIIL